VEANIARLARLHRPGSSLGQACEHHATDGIEIGAPVEARSGAKLLGRRVSLGACLILLPCPLDWSRKAEVDEAHAPIALHHDIAWLHVAMDETDAVHCAEGRDEMHGEIDRLIVIESAAAEFVGKSLPLDQLHDDIRKLIDLTDFENGWQPGVVHASQRNGFAINPLRPTSSHERQLYCAKPRPLTRAVDDRIRSTTQLTVQLGAGNVDGIRHMRSILLLAPAANTERYAMGWMRSSAGR
jgi:hypothetical protein